MPCEERSCSLFYRLGDWPAHAMIEHFIRVDDVDSEESNLERLVSMALKLRVPISLGIIPATLTNGVATFLNSVKRRHPELIELHQHGWAHVNHERDGRKGEFGPARPYDRQREDLRQGRDTLEQLFGDGFFPAFSPPWNVYTADTIRAMTELGFRVLSAGWHDFGVNAGKIHRYSSTVDLMDWDAAGRLRTLPRLFMPLAGLLAKARGPVGLLLHHRTMAPADFGILESMLHRLTQTDKVAVHTFESLEMKRLRALGEPAWIQTTALYGGNDGK